MRTYSHHCPTCGRPFKSILDYPRVRILSFERLPTPEAIDSFSEAAARKGLARRKKKKNGLDDWRSDGINMTPAIERACQTPAVQAYLSFLESLPGQEAQPKDLLPSMKRDNCFKWAYPIEDTGIYISLSEEASAQSNDQTAEVQVHCDGPNMGSAGGPTLQPLGAIARLRYEGMLHSSI